MAVRSGSGRFDSSASTRSGAIISYLKRAIEIVNQLNENIILSQAGIIKVTYYEVIDISVSTNGSLQDTPAGATIEPDEFGQAGNSILSTVLPSGKPSYESPKDAGGVFVTANVATDGSYSANLTFPEPVALIYAFTINQLDFTRNADPAFTLDWGTQNIIAEQIPYDNTETNFPSFPNDVQNAIEALDTRVDALAAATRNLGILDVDPEYIRPLPPPPDNYVATATTLAVTTVGGETTITLSDENLENGSQVNFGADPTEYRIFKTATTNQYTVDPAIGAFGAGTALSLNEGTYEGGDYYITSGDGAAGEPFNLPVLLNGDWAIYDEANDVWQVFTPNPVIEPIRVYDNFTIYPPNSYVNVEINPNNFEIYWNGSGGNIGPEPFDYRKWEIISEHTDYAVVDFSQEINKGYGYYIDSATVALNILLNDTADFGDTYRIFLQNIVNDITFDGNGNTIAGQPSITYTILDTSKIFEFIWVGGGIGWAVTQINVGGTPVTSLRTVVTVAGDYTLTAGDLNNNAIINCENTAPATVTFPNINISDGTRIDVIRNGTGTVTVTPDPGVEFNEDTQSIALPRQYDRVALFQVIAPVGTSWVFDPEAVGASTGITDTDGDTFVIVENTPDDDTVRHFSDGEEVFRQIPGGDVFIANNAANLDIMQANLTRPGNVNVFANEGFGTGMTVMRPSAAFRVGYALADQDGLYRSNFMLNGDNLTIEHGAGAANPDGNLTIISADINSNMTLGRRSNMLFNNEDYVTVGTSSTLRLHGGADAVGGIDSNGASIGHATNSNIAMVVYGAGDVRIDIDANNNETNRRFHVTKDDNNQYLFSVSEQNGFVFNAPSGTQAATSSESIRIYDRNQNAADNAFNGSIEWYGADGGRAMYIGQQSSGNQNMIILNDVGGTSTELILQQDGAGSIYLAGQFKGKRGNHTPGFTINTSDTTVVRWSTAAILRRDTPRQAGVGGYTKFSYNDTGGNVTVQSGHGNSGNGRQFTRSATVASGSSFAYWYSERLQEWFPNY